MDEKEDPFFAFTEWTSTADEKAFAFLSKLARNDGN